VKKLPFFILLLFWGCATYQPIVEITENPKDFENETVTIKGTVVETLAIPLINNGLYKVDDNTGSIWILSRDVPLRGERVVVKGDVKTAITISNKTFGTVIIEKDKEIKSRDF